MNLRGENMIQKLFNLGIIVLLVNLQLAFSVVIEQVSFFYFSFSKISIDDRLTTFFFRKSQKEMSMLQLGTKKPGFKGVVFNKRVKGKSNTLFHVPFQSKTTTSTHSERNAGMSKLRYGKSHRDG